MKKPRAQDGPKPLDLDAVGEVSSPKDTADENTKAELNDLERAFLEAHLKSFRQDTEERKTYANRIFCLVSFWLIGVFLLLVAQGVLAPRGWFDLSDSVLIAAISGTTINVIGIFVVVARYLFPRS